MTARVAAVGDIHVHEGIVHEWQELLEQMTSGADILVLAGDLTNRGLTREAECLASSLAHVRIPIIAVLGNHDHEGDQTEEITRILCDAGVVLLDEEPHEVDTVGFAGCKGFCGGFDRHALAPFGEAMIKEFVRESLDEALHLESGLSQLRTPHRVAVLHYAPIRETVEGEPMEIFPFLGSSRLADPLDHFEVTAAVHGHAHRGAPRGATSRGVPVYNVSLPLMRRVSPDQPYCLLDL